MSDAARLCHCGKSSCMPEPYAPICSRHYMLNLREDDAARGRRDAAVKKALESGDRDAALAAFKAPISDYRKPIMG